MMCIWSTWTQLDIDYSSNGCGRMRIEFTCCLHAGSALSHRCLYSANQDFSYSGLSSISQLCTLIHIMSFMIGKYYPASFLFMR